jgi:hypothetical protein
VVVAGVKLGERIVTEGSGKVREGIAIEDLGDADI